MSQPDGLPRSLVWATDIQTLPRARVVERRDGYLVVRSPENPEHYWGNFLLFDDAPAAGAARRWEQLFDDEFLPLAGVRHMAFAWDRLDGALGEAREEFVARSYELEQNVGLTAPAGAVRAHPRESREVTIAALDPRPGADTELWAQVVDLWVCSAEVEPAQEAIRRSFSGRRLGELRALFSAGMGSWYVALEPGRPEVVGSCGIVASGSLGRFQSVHTRADRRRRGICSRLLVEACRHCEHHHQVERFVIAADASYHALGLYESLGFEAVERVAGVCLHPAPGRVGETGAATQDGVTPNAGGRSHPAG
jgi:ribosomal protein S18 acetylase RimI-like enzyme